MKLSEAMKALEEGKSVVEVISGLRMVYRLFDLNNGHQVFGQWWEGDARTFKSYDKIVLSLESTYELAEGS